ncbi:kinase-like domain-containing protein [Rhizophagus irregularis DAOM 181602=DAOM 197198]|nr:kinase-like domain-containing protein [Rhizophagus irregularis DAOM 181602=DAOM 197198]
MQVNSEYYKIDDNHPQLLNKWKLASDNIDNNLLHEGLPQVIHYFNKMNIKEVEPTTQNINGNIYEEDLTAELENDVAQFELANMYIDGEGTGLDYDKAFKIINKLAKKECPCAIVLLGYCYEKGIGTDINEQKAIELYQKGADLGSSSGINNLGCCYNNGIGTEVNMQKAFELYKKAAKLGNDFAQYNLALMYENGDGTENDMNEAIYCIRHILNIADNQLVLQ